MKRANARFRADRKRRGKQKSEQREIYGETWYKSTVTVPLETSFDVLRVK
ncbi:hypothetical protein PO124_17390 [Bacillus licheniformis]|nr:hypothetical protein [Bacillus licheniformis]